MGATRAAEEAGADQVLDALGDPTRRAILEVLADGPRSVQAIADELPVSRPAVSRHLRLLKAAELVGEQRQGTRHVFALRAEGVRAVQAYFAQVWQEAAARYAMLADNLDGAREEQGDG